MAGMRKRIIKGSGIKGEAVIRGQVRGVSGEELVSFGSSVG